MTQRDCRAQVFAAASEDFVPLGADGEALVGTNSSFMRCAAVFALGLTQALVLPTIGYVTLLEVLFMFWLPFALVRYRSTPLPRNVTHLAYALVAYGILGVVIDIARQAETAGLARHIVSTYLFLSCFLGCWMLCAGPNVYFRWFTAGFGLSTVFRLILGPTIIANESWFVDPWAYGVGIGLPIFALSLLPHSTERDWRRPVGMVLVVCAAIGLVVDARSTALLTLLAASPLIFYRPGSRRAVTMTPAKLIIAAILLALMGAAGLGIYTTLASSGALGENIKRTHEIQWQNPHGAVVAIRPDFVVGLEAVARRPLFGYGSRQEDAAEFVARRAALVLQSGYGDFAALIEIGKIPSHSILLNAWLQVGVFGGLLWVYLLSRTVATLPTAATSAAPLAPLCLFLCLVNAWTIPFSPGPPRVDVALGLAVMYVFREQHKLYARSGGSPIL